MIISNKHRFLFMHIPKCGGTSIRYQLEALDDTDKYFFGNRHHEVLGKFDFSHVTLPILAKFFPETFEKTRTYRSFAVCRDPMARFQSAVSQYSRQFGAGELSEQSLADQHKLVDDIIAMLSSSSVNENPELKHFQRQVDFVYFDDERIIHDVYPISKIDAFLADVESICEQQIGAPIHKNETTQMRFEILKPAIRKAGAGLYEILPRSVFDRVQRFGKSILLKRAKDSKPELFASAGVVEFVQKHYRADFELYNRCIHAFGDQRPS